MASSSPQFRIRIVFGPDGMMGPGKADLLDAIARTGSIAAAGREMGMSYRRAWALVDTMNAMFTDPLVESTRGGASGGGARVTPTGQAVLEAYRDLETAARAAGDAPLQRLQSLLRDD